MHFLSIFNNKNQKKKIALNRDHAPLILRFIYKELWALYPA